MSDKLAASPEIVLTWLSVFIYYWTTDAALCMNPARMLCVHVQFAVFSTCHSEFTSFSKPRSHHITPLHTAYQTAKNNVPDHQ